MPEWLQSVLPYVGGIAGVLSAVFSGALWFGRKAYETRLQTSLEKSKAELARFAVEHQVKFSYLYTKRAEVIEEGYAKLQNLFDAVNIYVSPLGAIHGNAREPDRIRVGELLSEVRGFWLPKVIYLSQESADSLEDFLKLLNGQAINFRLSVDRNDGVAIGNDWATIHDTVDKQGKALLRKLADDYRKILGSESGQNKG